MIYELFLIRTPLTILLSTLSWVLTFVYFNIRSPQIELCSRHCLLYLGVLLLVFGNFAVFLQHVAARQQA